MGSDSVTGGLGAPVAAQPAPGPPEPEGGDRRRRQWVRFVPPVVAALALVALVVTANPGKLIVAGARFPLVLVPMMLALSWSFYVIQAIRWWTVLRADGIHVPIGCTVFATISGQATAMLPLGELGRSVILSKATHRGIGVIAATEAVQELLFVGILLVAAIPAAMAVPPAAMVALLVSVALVVAVVALLSLDRTFRWVLGRVVARIPGLEKAAAALADLQHDFHRLLHRRGTYLWLWLSVVQMGVAVTLLWLSITGLGQTRVTWPDAALIYAVTQGAGWITMTPGGLGSSEATTAGMLVAFGSSYGTAAAAALIFRIADKGVATLTGIATFAALRSHYKLKTVNLLRLRQSDSQRRSEASNEVAT